MQDDNLSACQEVIGYQFKNPDLLSLALTHSSLAATRFDSNERLEFLGDAVLGLVVCHDLFDRYESLLEGEMTKIKSSVVSRQTCAEIAERIGLSGQVLLGKGIPSNRKLPQSVAAAVFESIIGAIYVDGGLDAARRFILTHAEEEIEAAFEDAHRRNFKSVLQQHAQRKWGTTPEYMLLDEKGPDHSKAFEIAVVIRGRSFPSAWGNSKKLAEQEAARRALSDLDLLDDDLRDEMPLD